MKRAMVFALACIFMVGLGNAKVGEVQVGTFDVTDDVKFWTEMFKGGGPGQLGNTLTAVGDGFHFDHATLSGGGWVDPQDPSKVDNVDGFIFNYRTIYEGGDLTLGPNGPWYSPKTPGGSIKVRNVTTTNYNLITTPDPFNLNFYLKIEGDFVTKGGISYHVIVAVKYAGTPEVKYDTGGSPVFMKGTLFDEALITISLN